MILSRDKPVTTFCSKQNDHCQQDFIETINHNLCNHFQQTKLSLLLVLLLMLLMYLLHLLCCTQT